MGPKQSWLTNGIGQKLSDFDKIQICVGDAERASQCKKAGLNWMIAKKLRREAAHKRHRHNSAISEPNAVNGAPFGGFGVQAFVRAMVVWWWWRWPGFAAPDSADEAPLLHHLPMCALTERVVVFIVTDQQQREPMETVFFFCGHFYFSI